jgi:hypothetical protein
MKEEAPEGALIPPKYVSTPWGSVPQYAPPVQDTNSGYNPAEDCQGYFMSYKYQPNNNCYAYGCNIASNSFPQPGRYSGGTPFTKLFTAESVMNNALKDGLKLAGTTLDDIKKYSSKVKLQGHYVALMFSSPEKNIGGDPNANWPGDYHWARCDDPDKYTSWSQKDGGDQVTNFDFAGNLIIDPAQANWRVNQGPISKSDTNEYVVSYDFCYFMFVPNSGVNII